MIIVIVVLRLSNLLPSGVVAGKTGRYWQNSVKNSNFPGELVRDRQLHLRVHRMSDDQLRYLMEHAEDLIPVLFDHARMVAIRDYRWREGKTLPLGKTPGDIVTDAYVKYITRERNFDPTKDMMLQLKGTVRSLLWALHDKASTKKELVARSDDEAKAVVELGSNEPTPAENVESADFSKAVVERVSAHPKIKANQDLQDLIAAFEMDVTDVPEQAEMLGKKSEQISQLRFQLRAIILEVIQEVNKD